MFASFPMVARVGVVVVAMLSLLGTGCTKMSERTHAKYELGKPFKFRPAEPGGVYQVKWSATEDGVKYAIQGSQRTVAEGELVGFSMDNSGLLIAIAGESKFPISPLPPDAKFFFWSTEFIKGSDADAAPYVTPEPPSTTTAPSE
jgi:hypothetical protein